VWSVTARNGVEPITRTAVNTASPDASVAPGAVSTSSTESAPALNASSETQTASLSLVGSTSDLSDADLELLVAELDEMEPLPAEEPQSFTNTVEDLGSDEDSGL
jgi:hypothetical protein